MGCIRISVIVAIAAAAVHAASTRPAYAQAKPDLVVLIAVDQFSAGLFEQWRGRFKSGLKRVMDEGIVYSSAYQSHGLTETCAGHSTMLTGKHPRGPVSSRTSGSTPNPGTKYIASRRPPSVRRAIPDATLVQRICLRRPLATG